MNIANIPSGPLARTQVARTDGAHVGGRPEGSIELRELVGDDIEPAANLETAISMARARVREGQTYGPQTPQAVVDARDGSYLVGALTGSDVGRSSRTMHVERLSDELRAIVQPSKHYHHVIDFGDTPNAEMTEGTVHWFNPDKGYGFVRNADGEAAFTHFRDLQAFGYRDIDEGQAVRYNESTGDRGLEARNVSAILDDAAMADA